MKQLAKHVALALLWSVLFLLLLSNLASAEFIYNIEGVFAPALNNPVSASFTGELTFPQDDVSEVSGWVELTNEPDTPREFVASMSLNLPGSLFQPWDTRLYAGLYNEQPMTMILVDYDQAAGSSLLASELDGGGGWDGWSISFTDYPVGSISNFQAVNEPAGWALAVFGAVLLFGLTRSARRK